MATRPNVQITMSLSKVVIAGGTGFVGRALSSYLLTKGTSVTVLTRNAFTVLPTGAMRQIWASDKLQAVGSDWLNWEECLSNADLVVNLCGESVLRRWNVEGKDLILSSRLSTTKALTNAIRSLAPEARPKCLVNASAVGYYGCSDTQIFEEDANAGEDFLADVCVQWEQALKEGLDGINETRGVMIRTGIVMGKDGGAMKSMIPAFKLLIGGPLGSGKQWVPWIHIRDLVKIYERAGEDDRMIGAFNAAAPNPVRMDELAQQLGKVLGRPSWIPVPEFAVKAGLGEAATLLVDGQRVSTQKLGKIGFEFEFPKIEQALTDIVRSR